MAGDWLKVEHATPDKTEIARIARVLKRPRHEVFGACLCLWIHADQHGQTVGAGVDADVLLVDADYAILDDTVGVVGLCDAMEKAGWLRISDRGVLFARGGRHLTQTAKTRALKSKRQARWRRNPAPKNVDAPVDANVDGRARTTAVEKRREEKSQSMNTYSDSATGDDVGSGPLADLVPKDLLPDLASIFGLAGVGSAQLEKVGHAIRQYGEASVRHGIAVAIQRGKRGSAGWQYALGAAKRGPDPSPTSCLAPKIDVSLPADVVANEKKFRGKNDLDRQSEDVF